MPEITSDWEPEDFTLQKANRGQQRGRIVGRGRNSSLAAAPIINGIAPNRQSRRWYQRTVTQRSARLHVVLFGAWRKHDGRQQLAQRRELLSGVNEPVDGLTRQQRRADYLETYRAGRKNRLRRITPSK